MTHDKKIIDLLDFSGELLYDVREDILLTNCIINKMMIAGGSFLGEVKIINCIINDLTAIGRYFENGLLFSNCIVNDHITFEAGVHNAKGASVVFENNVFNCFVDFFDVQFDGPFIFRNNILLAGSNLLGNKEDTTATRFESGIVEENNIGDLCVDLG